MPAAVAALQSYFTHSDEHLRIARQMVPRGVPALGRFLGRSCEPNPQSYFEHSEFLFRMLHGERTPDSTRVYVLTDRSLPAASVLLRTP